MNPMNLQQLSVSQIQSKIKNKKELHQFLVQDCQAYLPPLSSTNVYFYKAILRGDKDYLKRDKVMVAAVPQIEGLTIEDILELFKATPRLLKFIPDERDWVHVDRKWLCDVLYSVDKANFQRVIDASIKKRKDRLEQSRDLIVEMKPEFAQAFASCMNFSSGSGRASLLMKPSSKRKRTKAELEEVKQEEELLKRDKHVFLQTVKRLREERRELQQVAAAIRNEGAGGMEDDEDEEEAGVHPQFNI